MTKIDDKRVPALRFKGFNDDWAQRKLKDLTDVRDGTHSSPKYVEAGHPFITSKNINNGSIDYRDIKYITDEDFDEINKRSKVDIHDILMGMIGTVGNLALIDKKPNFAIKNIALIKDIGKIDYLFLYNFLQSNYVSKELIQKLDGGTQKFISLNKVRDLNISVASFQEQKAISKCLMRVNNLLILQQRKMEQLKLLKKAMLQKGFTNKSAPTLRFKGFSKAWTEYPLGNLGKACSGYGFPNSEQGGNKGIPFYKVSDMNLAGNEDEMIYANNYVTDAQIDRNNWKPIVDVPAIFFAKVGAAVLLNRKRLCKRPFLLDNNTMAYSLNKNILSTQFTKSLFETINLPSFIQVGALPSYNTNDIESIKVKIPKIDEQEKIGILLKKIERLITRQQSKIKKLHSTKQFLLQNMFI